MPHGELVDRTLELVGPLEVSDDSRRALLDFAEQGGDLSFDTEDARQESAGRVAQLLTLIVASPEYQFA